LDEEPVSAKEEEQVQVPTVPDAAKTMVPTDEQLAEKAVVHL
jgi:hypothetical protein